MSDETARIRLLFVDDGAYRREMITLPRGVLEGYDRLIDCLREEPAVLKRLHVDVDRLCGAYLEEGDPEEEPAEGAGDDEGAEDGEKKG